jgi:uncharacterized protein involved in exopolysaccharide biosynthesis
VDRDRAVRADRRGRHRDDDALPRQYTAETSLVVEMRLDPALGALAPALAAPSYMATQVEILRSERVASRAVKLLGVERSAAAVAQWREATKAKISLERYFAGVLQRGLTVEPGRGSSIINLSFTAADPIFAQAARMPSRRPTRTSRSSFASRRRASRRPSSTSR